jgi:energy-coupling factor transport system permease protein
MTNQPTSTTLDPRAWLVWAMALSLVPMLGRNPFPLLAALVVALAVKSDVARSGDAGWGKLLKLAAMFATIGVLFNIVTYHGGDRVIGSFPEWIPVVGGPITLNALVFGILSGLALITLVVIWSTIAAQLEWSEIIRLTPPGLSGLAVSSSIAVTLVPKTIEAYGEIRDVQAIRGFPMRGPRDLLPLVSPLLTLGLERSVTLSEALESRGFGGPERPESTSSRQGVLVVVTLTALALAAFLIVTGNAWFGLVSLAMSGASAATAVRRARRHQTWQPTRYRSVVLNQNDKIVMAVSLLVAVVIIAINRTDETALFYEPYPVIAWPAVNLMILIVIALLLVPIVVTPASTRGGA